MRSILSSSFAFVSASSTSGSACGAANPITPQFGPQEQLGLAMLEASVILIPGSRSGASLPSNLHQ